MKKSAALFILVFLCTNMEAQWLKTNVGIKLRDTPDVAGEPKVLPAGTEYVFIDSLEKEYYHIKTKSYGEGYANKMWWRGSDATPSTTNTTSTPAKKYKTIFERFIEAYGQPTKRDEYNSGDYHSITFTWYCSLGNYRSVTFVYKSGEWTKDSEYTTDCIK
ncbi:MAG: hypothetical protein U0T33_07050 [Bacteroidales bacterium]